MQKEHLQELELKGAAPALLSNDVRGFDMQIQAIQCKNVGW